MVEEAAVNGGHAPLDLAELRKTLLSNSTKRRSNELQQLREKLVSEGR